MHIPQTANTCEVESQKLAKRFEMATKVKVHESRCLATVDTKMDGLNVKLYSLLLAYKASRAMVPYTASIDRTFDYTFNFSTTAYRSYKECISDISLQVSHFEKNTQLAAVAATCDKSTSFSNESYFLKIDGFGAPKKILSGFALRFDEWKNPQDLLNARHFIISLGGEIVREMGDSIYYYAPQKLHLFQKRFLSVKNLDECTSQIESVESILRKTQANISVVRCTPMAKPFVGYVLDSFSAGYPYIFENIIYPNRYYNILECMADRERVIAEKTARKMVCLGAICQSDIIEGRYLMNVYSE